ncbi:MAG: amidohydrolase family protein [Saprospiraceae bacterium]|nr:amidohydrolase family protein [Saprospiraceae bacterium]
MFAAEISAQAFYQVADYSKVRKYDVHVHVRADRNTFAYKAKADNFQLTNIVVDSKNSWDMVRSRFDYCESQRDHNPGTYSICTAFSMEGWDESQWEEKVLSWLAEGFAKGAVAVKVWKNIGMVFRDAAGEMVMIDDPKFDPIFDFIRKRNMTLMGHLGEPRDCWMPLDSMKANNNRNYFREHPEYHMYLHPELPSYQDQIDARDRMLAKHPNLRFIAVHLGSLEWDVEQIALRLDRFPNMAVDMAARIGHLFHQTVNDREKVRQFFIKYQDRILYGSDLGDSGDNSEEALVERLDRAWKRDWQYLVTDDIMTSDLIDEPFQGLKLPQSVVDKIYYSNTIRWLNLKQ